MKLSKEQELFIEEAINGNNILVDACIGSGKTTAIQYLCDAYPSKTKVLSIVATHLILAAADEGVNSCWINFFEPEEAAKALGLPENEEILMLMDLGYAAEGVVPSPNHTSRKPLSETVSYL